MDTGGRIFQLMGDGHMGLTQSLLCVSKKLIKWDDSVQLVRLNVVCLSVKIATGQ